MTPLTCPNTLAFFTDNFVAIMDEHDAMTTVFGSVVIRDGRVCFAVFVLATLPGEYWPLIAACDFSVDTIFAWMEIGRAHV